MPIELDVVLASAKKIAEWYLAGGPFLRANHQVQVCTSKYWMQEKV